MSRLDYLVEHAGDRNARSAQAPGDAAALGLCVVAPIDPGLTGWLSTDLGLAPGDAVVIRLPGGVMPAADGSGLEPALARSVAAACFLHGCEEVLLLGVEAGGATRNTASAIDALRKAEVDRSAVDGVDLRSFLGLQSDVRRALVQGAAALRAAPFLPSRLAVHAALVDPATGKLTVLESGYDKLRAMTEAAAADRGPVQLADPSLPPMPERWTPDGAVVDGAAQAAVIPSAADATAGIDPRLAAAMAEGKRRSRPSAGSATGASAGTAPSGRRPPGAPPSRALGSGMPGRPGAARPAVTTAPYAPSGTAPPRPMPGPPPVDDVVPVPAELVPRRAGDVFVDLAAGQVTFAGETEDLPPEILSAIQAVAYFVHDVYDDDERQMVTADVGKAAARGGAAMIDALLQPLLHLGPERYKVLNEMLVLKEQLVELPDPVVRGVLTEMLR